MQTSDQLDLLVPALVKARKAIKPAGKSGNNTFDRYNYATLEDYHRAVMEPLLDNGLVLSLSVEAAEALPDRTTKKGGTEYVMQVHGTGRLLHESGQWIEVSGFGQGQDRADKAVYKAITGMAKYLYATMFALPTSDDPERDESVGQSAGSKAKPTPPPPAKPDASSAGLMAKVVSRIEAANALGLADPNRADKLHEIFVKLPEVPLALADHAAAYDMLARCWKADPESLRVMREALPSRKLGDALEKAVLATVDKYLTEGATL